MKHIFKGKASLSKLVTNISNNTLHFIVDDTGRIVSYGTYKYKYG